ncbi:MAG TPA: NAD(P)-dependent oxidoreductase [Spirochaetia bacterium]|nr:NAD(P)-dependent oxidoreductase [Spirochaetia bacterium]
MAKILSLMPKIYFKDPGTLATLEAFKDDLDFSTDYEPNHIIAAAKDATCLLCPAPYPVISAEVINALPNLKLIQTAGAGYDKINIEAAARAGIPVANTPGINTLAVAELVLAAIIVLQRRFIYADREIKRGNYQPGRERLFQSGMSEVNGSRWGIIGLGRIGSKLAEAGQALGAEINYYKPLRKPEAEEKQLGVNYRSFEELLITSDVIIICVPLTGETRRLIGAREIQMMKPGAILINAARGGIVDDTAVAAALAAGHLGGAGLDTFEIEPLPADHPLLTLPEEVKDRLFLTPHLGGVTVQALNRMLDAALHNCIRVIRGERPLAVVNGVE